MIMKNKLALITGATSGIGEATAKIFAKNGIDLILCGRRQNRLDQLENELNSFCKIHTLNFDVRDKEVVFSKINELPKDFSEIDFSNS